MSAYQLHHPYQIDSRGRSAEADEAIYIRGLIEQVLFTSPGERVMRPDFGSGVMQLVFAPNSDQLAATTQFLVQSALQQWLGNLIALQGVEVQAVDAALHVEVRYAILRTGEQQVAAFTREGALP